MHDENRRLIKLRNRLKERLLSIEQTTMNGHSTERLPNNLNITFHGVRGDQLMTVVKDVAVSAGSACVSEEIGDTDYSHVLRAIGLNAEAGRSTIRFGLGRFTTEEEVDFAAERFTHAVRALRTYSLEGVQ